MILFDGMVSSEVLELARREARRTLISDRPETIDAMMVKLARSGKRVVWLRSGDATGVGRPGDAFRSLSDEDILVDVIPGVAAPSAPFSIHGFSHVPRTARSECRARVADRAFRPFRPQRPGNEHRHGRQRRGVHPGVCSSP